MPDFLFQLLESLCRPYVLTRQVENIEGGSQVKEYAYQVLLRRRGDVFLVSQLILTPLLRRTAVLRHRIQVPLDLMDQLLGCLGGLTEYFQFIAKQL